MTTIQTCPTRASLVLQGTRAIERANTLRGFSLIETMMTVAIVGILAALAGPSFTTMIQNNRVSTAASALQVSLSLARSEASKRGADARVTVAANGTAGSWTNGWTVFVDGTTTANAGVAPTADSAASCTSNCMTRLEVVGAPSGPLSYDQSNSTLNYFTFNGQGRLIDVSGGSVVNRAVWFYDSSSDKYCLILSVSGRVRTERIASSATCTTN